MYTTKRVNLRRVEKKKQPHRLLCEVGEMGDRGQIINDPSSFKRNSLVFTPLS
jgi:hypothetical protein